ncbi:MAG TPA: translocation/assembly module TamB domain-containing protein [Stellaceae bacterium]|nr:translocation/assembly module TamB domain-containing protein [Stellaceae bacterium]
MSALRRALKIAGGALAGLLLAVALAFGLLQTGPGKAWLAQRLAAALSGPGGRATVTGIAGLVPFDMRVAKIELADAQGPRLIIEDAVLSVAPADLLAGRLTVRELGARLIRVDHVSRSSSSTIDPATLLHPPVAVALERLHVDRLELGPALLGEPVALTLTASGRLGGGSAAADIDLHRIDGATGEARLHLALAGEPPTLALAAEAAEPSGRLLAGLLGRGKLPLTLQLAGDGPLADWHGRLNAAAGPATVDGDFRIARDGGYRVTAQIQARIAALLPPDLQPLLAGETQLSTTAHIADDKVTLDALHLAAAAGSAAASGTWARTDDAIAGQASVDLPALAALKPLIGSDIAGAAKAELSLAGRLAAPTARVTLAGSDLAYAGNRAAKTDATIDLRAAGDARAAATPIDVAASGHVSRLALAAATLPKGLGDTIDWRLAARVEREGMHVAVREARVETAGNTLTAHGDVANGAATGTAHLDLPDVTAFVGKRLQGALALDLAGHATADGAATATLRGTLRRAGDGTSPVEALLGNETTLAAELERQADGALAARNVTVTAANGTLSGQGRRAADGRLAGDIHLELPRLAAIDARLAGSASLDATVSGTADDPALDAVLRGKQLALGTTHLDDLEARLDGAGLKQPAGKLAAKFTIAHLDGTAAVEATLSPGDTLRLSRIRLDAAGTRLDGALTYRLADGTIDGTLRGNAPDLKPWSALSGTPVAGSATLEATLSGGKRQAADVALDGKNLAWGATPATVERLRVTARLSDILGKPQGRAEVELDHAKSGSAAITQLTLTGRSERPGRFALDASLCGTAAGAPLNLAAGASAALDGDKAELRLTKLAGNFGDQPLMLHRPLALSRRGADLGLADLDLGIGGGSLAGAGALKGNALSLHLLAHSLPVSLFAALGGQPDVTGLLGFEVTLSGTRVRPQGDVVIDAEQLRFAAASRPDLPPLGFVASASWRGDRVALKGRLAGPQNDAIGFAGAVPLVLNAKTLAPSLPPGGALAFHVEGEGELANLVDLLPIGEDRLAGKFTVDVSVGGTVAAPDAAGQLSLRNGRYESLSYGTILAGVSFDLVGNRDRLVLQRFAATDGDKGSLALAGAVNLAAAAGPTFDVNGQLKSFHAVRRDEAKATASGDVRLTGTVTAPSFAAKLRIDSAELRVPDRLPQNVQPIEVVKINSATGQVLSAPDKEQSEKHLLVVALGITVDLPGQVFVRGRGLDSEWRGHIALNGTSAAPLLTGKLEVVRGTYDFLGKTANLSKGTITFLGGKKIDPSIDIEARVASSDVTAIVKISGTATQPKIALSSQPELPQDEILSRVLFGTSVSQISAAQGIEIAQAAAALATGGGPGVLDKIRAGLGLDRLSFGASNTVNSAFNNVPSLASQPGIPGSQPATGVGTSPLPVGAGGASPSAGAAAVSAGKYVANGVYVGVTQGITSGSSSVDVQIDVSKHITLDTTAGQASGAGIGVDWKLDY